MNHRSRPSDPEKALAEQGSKEVEWDDSQSDRHSLGSQAVSRPPNIPQRLSIQYDRDPHGISVNHEPQSRTGPESKIGDLGDPDTIDLESPGKWVIQHHFSNLVEQIQEPKPSFLTNFLSGLLKNSLTKVEWESPKYRISFAELQRMQLRKLQCKLVKDVSEMYYRKKEPDHWEEHLQEYVQAMRNYDYMSTVCKERKRDPFLATGERRVDYVVLDAIMRWYDPNYSQKEFQNQVAFVGPLEPRNGSTPITGTRHVANARSQSRSFHGRFGMAAVGGAFLVAPMWLMVLHRTLYTALVSTTVFVIFFGIMMVFSLEKGLDVMTTTAAYAAVLVVFVGLNTSTS